MFSTIAAEASAIGTALTTGFQSVASDAMSTITAALPIALPIVGVGIVVPLVIKFFKRSTR